MTTRRRTPRKRTSPPSQSRAAWIASRARNALRRPMFIATVSVITFIAALVAIVVVPQQARRAATAIRPTASARPDTEPTATALAVAEHQVAQAESAIVAARTELSQLVARSASAEAADTTSSGTPLSPEIRIRRDSLSADVALLTRLLARTENAPLLGSYRALAEAPPMRGDVRVQQLLDSLVEIERERESFNAVGGVDPMFVALTARANELGHSIEALADGRRATLKQELQALAPRAPAPVAIAAHPLPDTLARIRARDTARTVASEVASRLSKERSELMHLDSLEARARELSNIGASPTAMLAAALVFGAMLGFGVALFDEVRRPRIATEYEVERATGKRVLGVIRLMPRSPERGRRASDREGPPYIDPGADGHQLIYLSVASAGANVVVLTVTGDEPAVSAVVAINFAAIAAQEARATLLVDVNGEAPTVAPALRIPSTTGLQGIVDGRATWPEVVRATRIGRDRMIDVVSTGERAIPIEQLTATLQRDATRLSRRYEAIVVVASPAQASTGLATSLPTRDVIYCARVGRTPIAQLKRAIEEIEQVGGNVRGVVMWDATDPVLMEVKPEPQAAREPVAA